MVFKGVGVTLKGAFVNFLNMALRINCRSR